MGLLGVARANTAVGVSPETFLLLLLLLLHVRAMYQSDAMYLFAHDT
jgi:hypothetical protein